MTTTATWTSASAEPGYYGAPIVKPAPWKKLIAGYFFTGGLAGGSSVLAATARYLGQPAVSRHARHWALAGLIPSPVFLVADLGRPARFPNMLRVVKPTSPMSVGSWLLAVYGPTATAAAALAAVGRLPRLVAVCDLAAGALGSGLATYTAVLLSDTATPVWHESRRTLPFLFAASSAATAGAATSLTVPAGHAGVARALGVAGSVGELAAGRVMERQLGPLDRARRTGPAGRYRLAAEVLAVAGAGLLAFGRRRSLTRVGGLAAVASSLAQRLCVLESGKQSARDPAQTLAVQDGRAVHRTSRSTS
jgi:Polysulphide reductase, NrfD